MESFNSRGILTTQGIPQPCIKQISNNRYDEVILCLTSTRNFSQGQTKYVITTTNAQATWHRRQKHVMEKVVSSPAILELSVCFTRHKYGCSLLLCRHTDEPTSLSVHMPPFPEGKTHAFYYWNISYECCRTAHRERQEVTESAPLFVQRVNDRGTANGACLQVCMQLPQKWHRRAFSKSALHSLQLNKDIKSVLCHVM